MNSILNKILILTLHQNSAKLIVQVWEPGKEVKPIRILYQRHPVVSIWLQNNYEPLETIYVNLN